MEKSEEINRPRADNIRRNKNYIGGTQQTTHPISVMVPTQKLRAKSGGNSITRHFSPGENPKGGPLGGT